MELNTTLFRKEPRFDTRLCKVEKILELSGSDFVHLKENLLEEYDFLIRYRDLMGGGSGRHRALPDGAWRWL